jgi:hypothetical protein
MQYVNPALQTNEEQEAGKKMGHHFCSEVTQQKFFN